MATFELPPGDAAAANTPMASDATRPVDDIVTLMERLLSHNADAQAKLFEKMLHAREQTAGHGGWMASE